ncbi:VOC family protein [Agrococcus baldri]|uniref:VOC domain-containing protein n=1 Tax=Agrococcus baldri TaxID=153730 RepID=A0AA87RLI5_9MICO|nr:VOC family protein [Agrococcus baldri]GEK81233.1 hypothetical protein ABA31_25840 [Agrococcus baldri]
MVTFGDPQVILFSADVERAAAFYRAFGFAERFRTPALGAPIHVDLELDGMRFGIASIASTRDDHGLAPVDHGQRAAVILWCDDVDAALAETEARGIPTLAAPEPWLTDLRIAWIADPDGHPVQLVQRTG